jgi:hypothetical protein
MTDTKLPSTITGEVARSLDRFRASLGVLRSKVRKGILIEGLGFLGPAFFVYYMVTFGLDRMLRLEMPARAVLLVIWLVWVVRSLFKKVWLPLQSHLVDDELALAVERATPGLGQRFISALQFSRTLVQGDVRGESEELMAEAVLLNAKELEELHFSKAIRRERLRREFLMFGGAFLLSLVVAGMSPQNFKIWAQRNLLLSRTVDWPRKTHLSFVDAKDGILVSPRGDDLTIRVSAEGVIPERVFIHWRFLGGNWTTEPMVQNTGEALFSVTFPGLMDPIQAWADGGDGITKDLQVRLVDRPMVEELTLSVHFPQYMGKKDEALPIEARELVIPEGATLALGGKVSKKIVKAWVEIGRDPQGDLKIKEGGEAFEGSIAPKTSGLFVVALEDETGLREGLGRRLILQVVPDRPPRVKLAVRGVGAKITPMAKIPIEVTAVDDFGLSRLRLLFAKGKTASIGAPDQIKAFRETKAEGLEDFDPGSPVFDRPITFDLLPLLKKKDALMDPANPIRPGDFLAIRLGAKDNRPGSNNKPGEVNSAAETISDAYAFRVVTPAELLSELLRRQNEQRVEFEKLLKQHLADAAEFRDLQNLKKAGPNEGKLRRRILTLARHQRHLGRAVSGIGKRYEGILDEMLNNRLAEESRIFRLKSRIVEPLDLLGTRHMPSLAGSVRGYARSAGVKDRALVSKGYDEVSSMMRNVLRYMTRLETFTRILNTLREVIRFEESAREKAKAALKKEMNELFGSGKDSPGKDGKER